MTAAMTLGFVLMAFSVSMVTLEVFVPGGLVRQRRPPGPHTWRVFAAPLRRPGRF